MKPIFHLLYSEGGDDKSKEFKSRAFSFAPDEFSAFFRFFWSSLYNFRKPLYNGGKYRNMVSLGETNDFPSA